MSPQHPSAHSLAWSCTSFVRPRAESPIDFCPSTIFVVVLQVSALRRKREVPGRHDCDRQLGTGVRPRNTDRGYLHPGLRVWGVLVSTERAHHRALQPGIGLRIVEIAVDRVAARGVLREVRRAMDRRPPRIPVQVRGVGSGSGWRAGTIRRCVAGILGYRLFRRAAEADRV